MRRTGLLALLLFFLIVFFAAPAASYAQASRFPAASADSKSDVLILPDNPRLERSKLLPASPEVDRPLGLGQPLLEHSGDMVLRDVERDGVCYTMRTYVMAREEKTSDVTRMVRYRKCLPGWKLDLRDAIAPVTPGRTP